MTNVILAQEFSEGASKEIIVHYLLSWYDVWLIPGRHRPKNVNVLICWLSVLIAWNLSWLVGDYLNITPAFFKVRSCSSTCICGWRNTCLRGLLRPGVASSKLAKMGSKVKEQGSLVSFGGEQMGPVWWWLNALCFVGWAELKYSVLFLCSYSYIFF